MNQKFKSSTLTKGIASTSLTGTLRFIGVASGIFVSCFSRTDGVSSEAVRTVPVGNSVAGSAGEESITIEIPFAVRCSDGGTAEESTRSDSEVSFEAAITGSWADMGRKSGAIGSVGWTKVWWRWWVGKQTDGLFLNRQMPLDNDRQN